MGCLQSAEADRNEDQASGAPNARRTKNWTLIWDALKAACETDVETAKLIIDSAGIIVAAPDMHICYDELGAKYELPQYVLSDPINMAPSNPQQA
ncbi:hypothetical protein QJQ45_000510 [Haematococcus lacustris]|nr:hypothetical protein QJQ45_000510 [Haematococcus lacustris]